MTQAPTIHSAVRTFEIVCNVNGYLEGGVDDWPAQMQDQVYAALELKSKQVELPLTIIHSYCGHDIDTGFFCHIIASEIVVADTRVTRLN